MDKKTFFVQIWWLNKQALYKEFAADNLQDVGKTLWDRIINKIYIYKTKLVDYSLIVVSITEKV